MTSEYQRPHRVHSALLAKEKPAFVWLVTRWAYPIVPSVLQIWPWGRGRLAAYRRCSACLIHTRASSEMAASLANEAWKARICTTRLRSAGVVWGHSDTVASAISGASQSHQAALQRIPTLSRKQRDCEDDAGGEPRCSPAGRSSFSGKNFCFACLPGCLFAV